MRLRSEFLERAAGAAVLFPLVLLSRLPYQLLLATVGRCCYFLTYSIARYRYHVVLQNLARAFPEKPYAEIHALARKFYWCFSCFIVEMFKSISISHRELASQVHVVNVDLVDRYRREGRPMVALLGHYGNWESLSILPRKLPVQVNALYKPLSNKWLCYLVRRIRSRFGMRLIPAQTALRQLMKAGDPATLSLFIADQFPGKHNGYRMELLNQSTALFDGAEKLAKAIDAVVFYVELERDTGSGWNVHFSLITEHAKETTQGEITHSFGALLEQTIRKAPAYWLWSHRRWK